jgi:hypothetical protein
MAVHVGMTGKFFHPMTFGVMHEGIVKKVLPNGNVVVKFDIDKKTYTTYPEHIKRKA